MTIVEPSVKQARQGEHSLPKTSQSTSSRRSDVQILEESIKIASAAGSLRRERSQSSSQIGETFELVLDKILAEKLEKVDLISSQHQQERESVIVHTPSRNLPHKPSSSPHPPLVPPRLCQSLSQFVPPPACSPSCSELSSINGDVF